MMIGLRSAAAATAAALLVPFAAGSAAPATAAPLSVPVQSRAVSFQVHNTNRSMVPCEMNRVTITGSFWPMRCARLIA